MAQWFLWLKMIICIHLLHMNVFLSKTKSRRKEYNLSNHYWNSNLVVTSYITINFEPLKSMKQNSWLHWHKFWENKSKYFHSQKKFLCWSPKISLIPINILLGILCKIFSKLFYACAFNQHQSRHLRAKIACFSPNRSIFLVLIPFEKQLHCLKKSIRQSFVMEMRFAKRKTFPSFRRFMYRRWAKKFSIIDLPTRDEFSAAKCLSIKMVSVHHIDYAIVNCSAYIVGSKNWCW